MVGLARSCVGDRGLTFPDRHGVALRVRCSGRGFHWFFGRSFSARDAELIRLGSMHHCVLDLVSHWVDFEYLIFILQLFQEKN